MNIALLLLIPGCVLLAALNGREKDNDGDAPKAGRSAQTDEAKRNDKTGENDAEEQKILEIAFEGRKYSAMDVYSIPSGKIVYRIGGKVITREDFFETDYWFYLNDNTYCPNLKEAIEQGKSRVLSAYSHIVFSDEERLIPLAHGRNRADKNEVLEICWSFADSTPVMTYPIGLKKGKDQYRVTVSSCTGLSTVDTFAKAGLLYAPVPKGKDFKELIKTKTVTVPRTEKIAMRSSLEAAGK